jgi:plasmid stabilization system protein ParE
MATIRLSAHAFANLQRITDFLIAHESTRALQVVHRIRQAILILENHPLIGRAVEDGRRELVISHGRNTYLALYRWFPLDDTILVLAIRDAREVGYRQE